VSEGHIQDIIQAEPFSSVTELMQAYEEWNPVNCEDLYVSPGLVDVNVQSNGPWEGLKQTTKAGIAGGVTFMLIEPSLYALPEEQEPLYCDVGHTLVVGEKTGLENISPSVFALKLYLSSPSSNVEGSPSILEPALSLATDHHLPLLIDPTVGNPRMMYMASPCRLSSLEERSLATDFPEDKVFAGAFSEELSPNSGSSSEDEAQKPLFPREVQTGLMGEMEAWRLQLPSKSVEIQEDDKELPLKLEAVNSTEKLSKRRKSAKLKNIYEDLDCRIKELEGSIEDLSRVEQLAYKAAGQTSFAVSRQRSHSFSSGLANDVIPQQTVAKKRPRPLALHTTAPKISKDRIYLTYLANQPDHWEANGISAVLSFLADKQPRCRVHFCNVSSASAISRITSRRIGETTITVETSPNYLYFTALSVQEGDTRLKSSPPIRNKLNCNLLWDLLKLGKIDILASHHQPIAPQFKYMDLGSFKKAVPGIACVGVGLQAVWSRLRAPMVESQSSDSYIMRLAKWTAGNPAALMGIAEERGSIAVGKWGDLVIWEPETLVKVEARGKFPDLSPYQGAKLRGKVVKVFVRGELAFDNGNFYPVGLLQVRSLL
jgi:dihydroorotase-like cyclic amidohydrolase